jgi:hypothetical protein
MSHKPEILRTETFETPAKWLKLERIMYRDQEGKEVSERWRTGVRGGGGWVGKGSRLGVREEVWTSTDSRAHNKRFWEVANRKTRSTAGVDSEQRSYRPWLDRN